MSTETSTEEVDNIKQPFAEILNKFVSFGCDYLIQQMVYNCFIKYVYPEKECQCLYKGEEELSLLLEPFRMSNSKFLNVDY